MNRRGPVAMAAGAVVVLVGVALAVVPPSGAPDVGAVPAGATGGPVDLAARKVLAARDVLASRGGPRRPDVLASLEVP